MKRIIVILVSLLMVGCIPLMVGCLPLKQLLVKKQVMPINPAIASVVDKEVSIKIKIKDNEQSLEEAVSDLNLIYGDPVVFISAFRSKDGKITVFKKLYYGIDKKVFTIVSVVNDEVIFVDTIHPPILPEQKIIINQEKK